MIKKILVHCMFLLLTQVSYSQIGIGTTTPNASSILDVSSTNKGLLPPRMRALQRNLITNPSEGLVIYCRDCCLIGTLSFFNGTKWININDCSDTDNDDDGILNNIDIDDDNDGILDKDESLIITENYSGPLNHNNDGGFTAVTGSLSGFNYSTSASNLTSTISYNDVRKASTDSDGIFSVRLFTEGGNGGIIGDGDMGFVDININPNNTNLPNSIVLSNPLEIEDIDATKFRIIIKLYNAEGLITDINDLEMKVIFGPGQTGTSSSLVNLGSGQFQITLNKDSGSGNNEGTLLNLKYLKGLVTKYSINIRESTEFSGDQISFPIQREIYQYRDSDGDGIANQYDLDSDGDGCSDSYESGLTTSTDLNFNYNNTDVGSNGLSNNIESDDTQNGVTSADTTAVYNGTCLL